ncbi:MAG: ABC transporter permease, partial [Bdellovibrionota bacterium]
MFNRLIALLGGVILIFSFSRALIRALPGDPLETLIAESGTTLSIETLRADLGLDRPYFPALVQDLSLAFHGNLGRSLYNRQPIGPLLVTRLGRTAALVLTSLFLGIAISLVLGVFSAGLPGSWVDRFCSIYGSVTIAMPTPWLGPLLMLALSVWIPLFPIGGHLALPTLTLALVFSGFWARLIRERVRETLQTGSADAARARGVSEYKVLFKYGLGPAAGALLAYFGTQLGSLMAGAFVTETLFDWPGMGALLVDAVLRRDYPVVEAATFAAATLSLIFNQLGDLA